VEEARVARWELGKMERVVRRRYSITIVVRTTESVTRAKGAVG
jgi:hypothetical protein